jgi:hypothetical protein
MPTPAMFSFSLGGFWPAAPSTWLGTMVNAAAAAAAPMKWRRDSFSPCLGVFTIFVMFVGPLKQPLIFLPRPGGTAKLV